MSKLDAGGSKGHKIITDDSTEATDVFGALEAIGDTSLTANCVGDIHPNAETTVSETLSDGRFIYGKFDTVEVTSGKLRAYYL